MNNLHLISQNMSRPELETKLKLLAQHGDNVLFIGEGVSSLLGNGLKNTFKEFGTKQIFALECDCTCRGISALLNGAAELVDDTEMVFLCAQAKQIISW
ncbi:DsrH/TusB family sulfur metabolism protein [Aliikangiella sp. G2MR2-5]|uniref:DsrH/TusB family sulfur metabolism protein n=1 Tax=Aliikangiella sp. G2MR2-5 TaxID=2788943 RepID=UPI0018A99237|nr:DsrH/TusB family sulfur metabolism protein [Aliikangiella sp. G2MR2-5]